MPSVARAMFRRSAKTTLAAGLMAMTGFVSSAVAETPIRATYDIYFGGLHMAEANADLAMNAADYSLDLTSRLRGISSVFSSWRLDASAQGVKDSQGVSPASYRMVQRRGSDTDTVLMQFDQGRLVGHTHVPERETPDPGDDDYIPDADFQGAVDPVSAMIVALHPVETAQPCQARVPVFDGRRRFDAVFSPVSVETLDRSRYTTFSGPATRCRVHLELVSGAFSSEDSDSFWRRGADRSDREMDVWFGRPVTGGPLVPVRMQGDTRLGRFLIHLRQAAPIGQ